MAGTACHGSPWAGWVPLATFFAALTESKTKGFFFLAFCFFCRWVLAHPGPGRFSLPGSSTKRCAAVGYSIFKVLHQIFLLWSNSIVTVSPGLFRTLVATFPWLVATITVFEQVQQAAQLPKLCLFSVLHSQNGQTGDSRWKHRRHLRIRSTGQ